jgi:hypothetical protein
VVDSFVHGNEPSGSITDEFLTSWATITGSVLQTYW